MSVSTGTRVPTNTGVPPMISGIAVDDVAVREHRGTVVVHANLQVSFRCSIQGKRIIQNTKPCTSKAAILLFTVFTKTEWAKRTGR
jgi:hypothetical protein